ncbi:cysteine--tRNA ligase [Coprothermobacteraceae bacterium]|nr:cysteine--tRNA ligase [Coprothermobacteraceae bacterium]
MRFYDTLTRDYVEINKRPGDKVVGYVCGLTPYDEPHMGHARTALVFDLLHRFLQVRGYQPILISNFTDVDDKIIERSIQKGIHPLALAEQYERLYYRFLDFLNVKPAYIYSRVSQVIPDIIEVIEKLIEKGHAYATPDGVYFSVQSFPSYGRLSKRSEEDLMVGARVEPSPYKKDPRDFALWKARKPNENIWWKSPWGEGRPGWHIECTVMSIKYGGYPLDFHGGGSDLVFPHHENEIAQSEALMGYGPFAKVWLHSGMLRIRGEEMHKSLGNFISATDIMQRYEPNALRYLLLSVYYRDEVNFTEDSYEQAVQTVNNLIGYRARLDLVHTEGDIREGVQAVIDWGLREFNEALEDDLNSAKAMAAIHKTIGQLPADELDKAEAQELKAFLKYTLEDVFGFRLEKSRGVDDRLIADLVELRSRLRQERRFEVADMLRQVLGSHGVVIEDTREGSRWYRI